MVDESHVLLVASRPCPVSPEENPYAEPQSVNVIRLTWDPVSQKFPVKELKELPDSTKVRNIIFAVSRAPSFVGCRWQR